MKFVKTALLASAAVFAAGSAHATFVGDQVDLLLEAPNVSITLLDQPNTLVADPGVEGTATFDVAGVAVDPIWTADLAATTATFTYHWPNIDSQVGDAVRWIISDLDLQGGLVGSITGLSLSSGNAAEVQATSFTADSITVQFTNFTALGSDPQRVWVFDIQHDGVVPPAPEVPLPAALPLMAAGIGALALVGRRRKS